MKIFRKLSIAGAALILSSPVVRAQGKKPENPPAEKPSHPVHDAKDGANQTMNDFDRDVHKAGAAAKKGANEAMDAGELEGVRYFARREVEGVEAEEVTTARGAIEVGGASGVGAAAEVGGASGVGAATPSARIAAMSR